MRKFCEQKYGRGMMNYYIIKLIVQSSHSRDFERFFFAQLIVAAMIFAKKIFLEIFFSQNRPSIYWN